MGEMFRNLSSILHTPFFVKSYTNFAMRCPISMKCGMWVRGGGLVNKPKPEVEMSR